MNKEEKITAIYKEIAIKEVAFGCRYEHNGSRYAVDSGNYRLMQHGDSYYLYIDAHCNCPIEIVKQYNDFSNQGVVEIIGHPVMIGDVIDYTGEKKIDIVWSDSSCAIDIRDGENSLNLFNLWDNKRTPIEDQSDECIDYVYSLIQKD